MTLKTSTYHSFKRDRISPFIFASTLFSLTVFFAQTLLAESKSPRQASGIYPSLAVFNNESECGIGAVVPFADRLWVITYAPHRPNGSTDKLYEITPDLQQIVRDESVGGTPANRFLHTESNQLFIGPYVVDSNRNVRVIPPSKMFGRLTGTARHLFDPANKVYVATMEEGIYEVDVHSLEVKELWTDEHRKEGKHSNLPGYHGKGLYSGQGLLIYANNGERGNDALTKPNTPSGVLASWDGKADAWTIVRRNQFTEVSGPGGISGNKNPESDPIWSIGWDHRSLILNVLNDGKWTSYRLPKSSHSYDGAHGWNTEWPRIRDIGEDSLLMTMHGAFWKFPKTFSPQNSAGITPRSNYLKVVGDFSRWQDKIILGCDDAAHSEFLNKRKMKGQSITAGQSQSNLQFLSPAALDQFGPVIGRGAVWLNDNVAAGEVSDPYLISGYDKRAIILSHQSQQAVPFTLEVDRLGNGQWSKWKDISVGPTGFQIVEIPKDEQGVWIRVRPQVEVVSANVTFQFANHDERGSDPDPIFAGLATASDENGTGGLLHARGSNMRNLRAVMSSKDESFGGYHLDGDLKLVRNVDDTADRFVLEKLAIPKDVIQVDNASVLYTDESGKRWRFPKGNPDVHLKSIWGDARVCREVCTERDLVNVHGTIFELPAENAGGIAKIRPVATHPFQIKDFTSYRGLLVLSGLKAGVQPSEHVVVSEDGKCSLWVGSVDDLWRLGKARGQGGPWKNSQVKAGVESDPYLMTGYDKKRLSLKNEGTKPATFTVRYDFSGQGDWVNGETFSLAPGATAKHLYPAYFNAYWVKLVSDVDTTATAELNYE